MSTSYKLYCHDCKIKSTWIDPDVKECADFHVEDHPTIYNFLMSHIGHNIEFNDFAKHAKKPCIKCYQPEFCEGDCYKEQEDE